MYLPIQTEQSRPEQSELHLRIAWAAAAQNGGQPLWYACERVSVCVCVYVSVYVRAISFLFLDIALNSSWRCVVMYGCLYSSCCCFWLFAFYPCITVLLT